MAQNSNRVLFLFVYAALFSLTNSAKLLFFIGIGSHSHRVALEPLINKMADKDHEVTVFSPTKSKIKNPNIQEFCPHEFAETNFKWENQISANVANERHKDRHYDPLVKGNNAFDFALQHAEGLLQNSMFVEWIQNSTFDLIVHDAYGTHYIYMIAHRMNAKVITFLPTGCYLPTYFDLWGLPLEPWLETFIPNYLWWLPNFVYNAISPLIWYSALTSYYLPKMDAIVRRTLPFDYPPLIELIRRIDLIFTNQHFSHTYAISHPPYVVPIGGMHGVESNGTLSQDLEEFLQDTDEFVLISFGTVVRVSQFPREIQQNMFDAVASFSGTRFLWKWEGNLPANLPKNVLTKTWFSQQNVLAHPKCKGFVTQGGIMSIQQAIFHKIPVIVIPGFGDQPYNAKIAHDLGFGIRLELAEITIDTFSTSLHQILKNNTYAHTINKISERFRDQPMSPVDTAVWWTEYVLRHDTAHLKSAGFHQTWWQRRSLDFWFLAFSLICICVVFALTITVVCIQKILRQIYGGKLASTKIKIS